VLAELRQRSGVERLDLPVVRLAQMPEHRQRDTLRTRGGERIREHEIIPRRRG
jgi:hypothetical protein